MNENMPSTPTVPNTPRRSLRRGQIALAAVAIAALVLAAAGWTAWSYFESINHLSRGTSPGVVEVTSGPGRIVVYYEGQADPNLVELEVAVSGPGGRSVPLQPFAYDLRYDVGKLIGHGVAVFDAPTAGRYVVTSRIPESAGRIAVGADLGAATVFMVLAMIVALLVGAFSVLLAVVFALTRTDRRPRARFVAPVRAHEGR